MNFWDAPMKTRARRTKFGFEDLDRDGASIMVPYRDDCTQLAMFLKVQRSAAYHGRAHGMSLRVDFSSLGIVVTRRA